MNTKQMFVVLGFLLVLTVIAKAQPENLGNSSVVQSKWQIEVTKVDDPKIFGRLGVYFSRLMNYYSKFIIPGTIVSGEFKPGGKVEGFFDITNTCSSQPFYTFLGNTSRPSSMWGDMLEIKLYDPHGKVVFSRKTKTFSSVDKYIEASSKLCEVSWLDSPLNYKITIPRNASPGKYKLCAKLYLNCGTRILFGCDPLSQTNIISGQLLGKDCDEFTIEETEQCQYFYWFDNTHRSCSYSKFCGTYMYEGLRTFRTKQECENALNSQPVPTPGPVECTPGFIGDKWCENNKVKQKYKQTDCSVLVKIVDVCSENEVCENGKCVLLRCEEGYVDKYCDGTKVVGLKYVAKGGQCIEKEEVIEDCSRKEGYYCENAMCVYTPPECPEKTVEIGKWKSTYECDEEGEIFERVVKYMNKDCEIVEKIETKVEASDRCTSGVPSWMILLSMLVVGGVIVGVLIVIPERKRKRKRR